MKYVYCIGIVIISMCMVLPVYADDLGIGISAWYADWEMDNSSNPKKTMDPVLCIGPSLSYQFSETLSVTLVALFTPKKYEMPDEGSEDSKLRRYDSDLALNYQLNRYIKLFAGAKYLGFTFEGGKHHGAGPGAGIGFTIPIVYNFYFLGNASGLYLYGNHNDNSNDTNYNEYGYNLAGQLAYYFPSIGLTTSLGYRYQYIKSDYNTNNMADDEHTFKGFTCLVVKSFHL
ncbi:MAG TPA: hypothetical protein PLE64_04460 [Spirochaetota bacterium]|nr:hypothetical protein [Spirochaetota bacterium]